MYKTFSYLPLIAFFSLGASARQQPPFGFMSTCQLSEVCTVVDGATSGTRTRANCGASFGVCTGYTCNSGYGAVGGICGAANIACQTLGTGGFATCSPISDYNLSQTFNYFIPGSCPAVLNTSNTSALNRKLYCPSAESSTWSTVAAGSFTLSDYSCGLYTANVSREYIARYGVPAAIYGETELIGRGCALAN